MYSLRNIQVEGFMSFRRLQSIPLEQLCYFIWGENKDETNDADSNGAGKTTIINAISYGLFGRTISAVKAGNVINDQCDHCRVCLDFGEFEIIREYGRRHKLTIHHKGASPIVGDVMTIQPKICELFGLTWATFINTCVMAQATASNRFLHSTPHERAAILGEIVDDTRFQAAAKAIKRDIEVYGKSITEMVSVRSILHQQIIEKQRQIASFQQEYQRVFNQESDRINALRVRIAELELRKTQIATELDNPPSVTLEELSAHVHSLTETVARLANQLQTVGQKAQATRLVAEGMDCPYCLRHIDKGAVDFFRMMVEDAKSEFQTISQLLESERRKLNHYRAEQERVANWFRKRESLRVEMEKITEQIFDYQDQISSDHMSMLHSRMDALVKELNSLTHQHKSYEDRLTQTIWYTDILKVLQPGLGQEIKNILFDQIRGELDGLTYTYSRELAGQMFDIYFPSKNRNDREKFEILMETNGKTRDISLYSTGEGWRAAFCVLLALRRTMINKTGSKLNMLLIDDPIAGLDKTGLRKLFTYIQEIQRKENNCVLVTIPDTTLLPPGHTLKVTKEGGCSSVH